MTVSSAVFSAQDLDARIRQCIRSGNAVKLQLLEYLHCLIESRLYVEFGYPTARHYLMGEHGMADGDASRHCTASLKSRRRTFHSYLD